MYVVDGACQETLVGALTGTERLVSPSWPGAVFAARTEEGSLWAYTQVPTGVDTYLWEVR
jgi:hypothetical protein